MKPCTEKQKLIVWLAANALNLHESHQLRLHLETCEGCRRYLAEISNVTEKLVPAEMNPDVQESEHFHRQVAGRLRAAKPDSLGEILVAYFPRLNWRVALPVMAALTLAGGVTAFWPQAPKLVAPFPPAAMSAARQNDLAPTLANYQRVANQSFDKLDALLTQQGKQTLPPMPIYTAATGLSANELF